MMSDSSKRAVEKAFEIGKILFSLSTKDYEKLIEATSNISFPSDQEIQNLVSEGMSYNESIISILKERYVSAAKKEGFTEKQGLAVLTYAAMLKEIRQ